jgi:hypothetical protein
VRVGEPLDPLVREAATGAGSQISLRREPDLVPDEDVPPGTTGQLTLDASVTRLREIAVHCVQPVVPPPVALGDPPAATVGPTATGAIAVIGMPVTHVIEPLAARIGAVMAVLVVVVVMVIT